jgi:hypothetical protein
MNTRPFLVGIRPLIGLVVSWLALLILGILMVIQVQRLDTERVVRIHDDIATTCAIHALLEARLTLQSNTPPYRARLKEILESLPLVQCGSLPH